MITQETPASAATDPGRGRLVGVDMNESIALCSSEECGKPVRARGYCMSHYGKARRRGFGGAAPCSVKNCYEPVHAASLCSMHYQRSRAGGDLDRSAPMRGNGCAVDECDRKHYSKTFCHRHYVAWRTYGNPEHRRIGVRGEGSITNAGYRRVFVDGRYVMEHRAVMERVLDRPLLDHENVHHINGDRLDNRPENLELWTTSQPSGQRVADKVAWAREILAFYGDEFPGEAKCPAA